MAGLLCVERRRTDRHLRGRPKQVMTERVIVVPYDPDWPRRFERERAVLATIFAGSEADIRHVGSTAVHGLGAKPVIDVMIGVSQLVEAGNCSAALEAAGYEYVQKYERELPERRDFRKPRLGSSACHLHCVDQGRRVLGSALGIPRLSAYSS